MIFILVCTYTSILTLAFMLLSSYTHIMYLLILVRNSYHIHNSLIVALFLSNSIWNHYVTSLLISQFLRNTNSKYLIYVVCTTTCSSTVPWDCPTCSSLLKLHCDKCFALERFIFIPFLNYKVTLIIVSHWLHQFLLQADINSKKHTSKILSQISLDNKTNM